MDYKKSIEEFEQILEDLIEENKTVPVLVEGEKDIAAFPEELPYRMIKMFSYKGETILDPFVGSGTTMKVAKYLNRNSIGFEIKKKLIPTIKEKLGFSGNMDLFSNEDRFEVLIRDNTKNGNIS